MTDKVTITTPYHVWLQIPGMLQTKVMRVPGGVLYRTIIAYEGKTGGAAASAAMVFVPYLDANFDLLKDAEQMG